MTMIARALSALLLSAACACGGASPKTVVYNDMGGDGGVALDRGIKAAYGARFTLVDTGRSAGYAGPVTTAGSMPGVVTDGAGRPIVGYVLAAYIVSAEGRVTDPVILKTTDARLSAAALDAMAHWRFTPATLNGAPVASTAAQEFNFGAPDASAGFLMDRVAIYQPAEVLLKRLPGADVFGAYLGRLKEVVHNFFVGDAVAESFSVVIALQPGGHTRIWFVSSRRPGDAAELAPLRALLLNVPPVEVREGPAAFAMVGRIAGGDSSVPPGDKDSPPPVPKAWRDAAGAQPGVPYSSDAFLARVQERAR